jgi:hypothetical protein
MTFPISLDNHLWFTCHLIATLEGACIYLLQVIPQAEATSPPTHSMSHATIIVLNAEEAWPVAIETLQLIIMLKHLSITESIGSTQYSFQS